MHSFTLPHPSFSPGENLTPSHKAGCLHLERISKCMNKRKRVVWDRRENEIGD